MRDVGTIPVTTFAENVLRWAFFIRVDGASPMGTKRYTDAPDNETQDIDGTSQVWASTGIRVGGMQQTKQSVFSVSWVEFVSLDQTWQNWIQSPGLKRTPLTVYVGWWKLDGTWGGSYKLFDGKIDEHEPGPYCRFVVIPHGGLFAKKVNVRKLGSSCIANFKDPTTCQYAGADATCDKTRSACIAKANEVNFLGWDFVTPGTIQWGPVVYSLQPYTPQPPPPEPPPPPGRRRAVRR